MRKPEVTHTKKTHAALLRYVKCLFDVGITEVHTTELIPSAMTTQFPMLDPQQIPAGITYHQSSGWFRKTVDQ